MVLQVPARRRNREQGGDRTAKSMAAAPGRFLWRGGAAR